MCTNIIKNFLPLRNTLIMLSRLNRLRARRKNSLWKACRLPWWVIIGRDSSFLLFTKLKRFLSVGAWFTKEFSTRNFLSTEGLCFPSHFNCVVLEQNRQFYASTVIPACSGISSFLSEEPFRKAAIPPPTPNIKRIFLKNVERKVRLIGNHFSVPSTIC